MSTPFGPAPAIETTTVLSTAEWQARAARHLARVRPYTGPRRERRARGESHPVHDFLFQYYHYSAGRLERWHPAPHEAVADSPSARECFAAPVYRVRDGAWHRMASDIPSDKRAVLERTRQLLVEVRDRPAHFGCYGLHEWAMVYGGHDIRHAGVAPLRLSQAEIDALVESRPVACSHFDAFRFFAPAAKPRNRLPLAWETRYDAEQPGCVHANMDLYRWAYTCMPWVGSDLLADTFELALALRDLDMQAGPYDLRAFGVEPVRIETAEGRAEYQRRQRALSSRASALRQQLIDALDRVGSYGGEAGGVAAKRHAQGESHHVDALVLVGPNGAGKSTIGRALARTGRFTYLDLEGFFVQRYESLEAYRGDRAHAYRQFEDLVRTTIASSPSPVVFEEVGLNDSAMGMLAALRRDYRVAVVELRVSLAACLHRADQRTGGERFPKSAESVQEVWERFMSGRAALHPIRASIDTEGVELASIVEGILQICDITDGGATAAG